MTYTSIDDFSTLVDSQVTVTNHKRIGTISKYEKGIFYIKYESDNCEDRFTVEDLKNNVFVLKDADKENAVILKFRLDELKESNSPLLTAVISKKSTSESSQMIVLEQWRMMIESAINVSSRRQSINNIFITLLTILISGVIFSDGLFDASKTFHLIVSLIVSFLGILICYEWITQMTYYGDLNDVKYSAIRDMEKYLPFALFTAEDVYFYSHYAKKKSFSKKESKIPFYFIGAFILIIIVAGLSLSGIISTNNKNISANNTSVSSSTQSKISTTSTNNTTVDNQNTECKTATE